MVLDFPAFERPTNAISGPHSAGKPEISTADVTKLAPANRAMRSKRAGAGERVLVEFKMSIVVYALAARVWKRAASRRIAPGLVRRESTQSYAKAIILG
jgi:hypothetical protein